MSDPERIYYCVHMNAYDDDFPHCDYAAYLVDDDVCDAGDVSDGDDDVDDDYYDGRSVKRYHCSLSSSGLSLYQSQMSLHCI